MTNSPSTEDILSSDSWRQLYDCEEWRVEHLVHFGESDDQQKKDRARLLLSGLRRRQARHKLCSVALEQERKWLDELLSATDYLPAAKDDLALFLLTTKQWERFNSEFADLTYVSEKLSFVSPKSLRARKSLREIKDVVGVKLLLRFYLSDAEQSGDFKNHLRLCLQSQTEQASLNLVFEAWEKLRQKRLASVIAELKGLPNSSRRLQLLAAFKLQREIPQGIAGSDISIVCDLCQDSEEDVANSAAREISKLDGKSVSEETKEQLFQMFFKDGGERLLSVLSKFTSRPSKSDDHTLFAVLTQNWDEFASLDPSGGELSKIYENASDELKARISNSLRSSARSEWITNVYGVRDKFKLSTMSDLDWQLLQNSLSASSSRAEIWRLIPIMPAQSARRFFRRLMQVGWRPSDEKEAARFDNLAYFAKRLSTEQVPIWSSVSYLGNVELGDSLIAKSKDGNPLPLDNRFGFSNDGTAFYLIDKTGTVRMWHLPSLLPAQFIVNEAERAQSIALSSKDPLIAMLTDDKTISICDLLERRIVHQKVSQDSAFPHRLGNLAFSPSGEWLSACKYRAERDAVTTGLLWQLCEFDNETKPIVVPPRSVISPDDQWLLYRAHGAIALTKLFERTLQPAELSDRLFHFKEYSFVPDSSAAFIRERYRMHLHELGTLSQTSSLSRTIDASAFISDQGKQKILCLLDGDSFGFVKIENSQMYFEYQSASFLESLSQGLRRPTNINRMEFFTDAQSTCLAVFHGEGDITFWTSPYVELTRKSPLLFNEHNKEMLRSGLLNPRSGDGELAWLRFVAELSGSLDHYAVEFADVSSFSLFEFDIELE